MELWIFWWEVMTRLRPAFTRTRTFLWFVTSVCGFCIRTDLLGVTSFVRSLGLKPELYDRLLDMFHGTGIKSKRLRKLWVQAVFKLADKLLWRVNGRIVLLGDGVKVPKSGRKMPAVKKLYQASEANTKPEYIFGHSLQAVNVVVKSGTWLTSIPLGAEIHEGVVESKECNRTLLDKMIELLNSLGIEDPVYYVMDAYYGAEKMVKGALSAHAHLITRMRSNAIAWHEYQADEHPGRGRRRKYGERVKLSDIFAETEGWEEVECNMYGEKKNVRLTSRVLLWRANGRKVQYVLVKLDENSGAMFMSTDLTLTPRQVLELYSARFRIEVGFKVSIRTVGAMGYHFWMKEMKKITREGKTQCLEGESQKYVAAVKRKLMAYDNYIQTGLVAHGTMTLLSLLHQESCWSNFCSWMRTMNTTCPPSEWVVAQVLRSTLPDFLNASTDFCNWAKFLLRQKDEGLPKAKVA